MTDINKKFMQLLKAEEERQVPFSKENTKNTKTVDISLDSYPEDLFDVDWNTFTIDNVPIVELLRLAILSILSREGVNISLNFRDIYMEAGIDDIFTTIGAIKPNEEEKATIIDKKGRGWRYYCTLKALERIESELDVDIEVQDVVLPDLIDVDNTIEIISGNPLVKVLFETFELESTPQTKLDTFKNLVEEALFNYNVIIEESDEDEFDAEDDEDKDDTDTEVDVKDDEAKIDVKCRTVEPSKEVDLSRTGLLTDLQELFKSINEILKK